MSQGRKTDLIQELGELAFASRLRRLTERLLRDASRIYKALDHDFEARWFGLFYALTVRPSMSVTALARTLGLTHPAVNQLARELIARRLVASRRDAKDDRRRLLCLTAKGSEAGAALRPVWEEIRKATASLIEGAGGGLLHELALVEKALDEESLFERVMAGLRPDAKEAVEILDYRPAFKKHFQSLNHAWLRALFKPEKRDEELLGDPKGRILRRGGFVLFARLDGKVVGTCALIRRSECVLELAKMAVEEKYQGRGIGRRLAEAAVERAASAGAEVLLLETSPKLARATKLYRSLGFRRVKESVYGPPHYERPTFIMELDLKKSRGAG